MLLTSTFKKISPQSLYQISRYDYKLQLFQFSLAMSATVKVYVRLQEKYHQKVCKLWLQS